MACKARPCAPTPPATPTAPSVRPSPPSPPDSPTLTAPVTIYPHDGETILLSNYAQHIAQMVSPTPSAPAGNRPTACSSSASGDPRWHLLWLLFPLFWLGKLLVATTIAWTTWLWQSVAQPLASDVSLLLAVVLIGTGAWLVWHNRERDT
ncbi:MAG: hypothetical protein HC911_01355 [Chloroflexaceae bacterium]|nr:hypothetical protein [Chloroflexaceae bacterium]